MSERRASAGVGIDPNLLLLQRQQWLDPFVLSPKAIKTMGPPSINIWPRTKESARRNSTNARTKEIYEQERGAHTHRILTPKN